MLRKLPHTVRGIIVIAAVSLNTLIICGLFLPFSLLKFFSKTRFVINFSDAMLIKLAEKWVRLNQHIISSIQEFEWQVTGTENLSRTSWYFVSCNHQSCADVVILQFLFLGRIPFLKFFLKQELRYVPVIGLAWWALDFPFMRGGKTRRSTYADLATARTSCEKFRHLPTAVINFLEGARFTPQEHQQQKSPFKHLLKPRTGAALTALSTLGDKLEVMLDVTIVRPAGRPRLWHVLSGQLGRLVVEVRAHPIPGEFLSSAVTNDPRMRFKIQDWLYALWTEKDQRIEALLALRGDTSA